MLTYGDAMPLMYAATSADRTAQEWEEWVVSTDGPYVVYRNVKRRRDGLTHALYLFALKLQRMGS